MRIVFRAHPAFGHVYPLMPLAEAARAAGHEVVFPTAPPFLERLAELGCRTIESGLTMSEVARRRFAGRTVEWMVDGEPNWNVYSELFAEAAVHAATDLLRQLLDTGADVLIYEDTDLAGGAVAGALGIPSVVVGTVRSLEPRVHAAFYGRPLQELDALFGAAPRADDPFFDTFPDSTQRPEFVADPRRRRMRMVPWSDPRYPRPPWIGSRRRGLVFVTLGTVVESAELRHRIIEVLSGYDVDIVLSSGVASPDTLGPLPENVYVQDYVNQASLLPHLDLVIHHGGAGTTTGAWACGVPQLVLPEGADRYFNGDAVAESGSGLALRDHTPELIEKAVGELLEDESYRHASDAIRREIASAPHPADVLADITATI